MSPAWPSPVTVTDRAPAFVPSFVDIEAVAIALDDYGDAELLADRRATCWVYLVAGLGLWVDERADRYQLAVDRALGLA